MENTPSVSYRDFGKMIVPIVAIILMSRIDFTNEMNIIYVRIGYSLVQTINLFLYLFCFWKISSIPLNPKEEKIDVVETSGETLKLNSQEYDFLQLKQFRNRTFTSLVIILFLHIQWGFVPPLFMQSLLGLSGLVTNPLVKVYIFGESLKRPWTDPESESPFKQLLSSFTESPKEEEPKKRTKKKWKQKSKIEKTSN